jgi:hypothetical protein
MSSPRTEAAARAAFSSRWASEVPRSQHSVVNDANSTIDVSKGVSAAAKLAGARRRALRWRGAEGSFSSRPEWTAPASSICLDMDSVPLQMGLDPIRAAGLLFCRQALSDPGSGAYETSSRDGF